MSAGSASHARRLPHPRGEKGAEGLPLICPTETSGRADGSALTVSATAVFRPQTLRERVMCAFMRIFI